MKVIAKYQLAYNSKNYKAGDHIEMNEKDYHDAYSGDVYIPFARDYRQAETNVDFLRKKSVRTKRKSNRKKII